MYVCMYVCMYVVAPCWRANRRRAAHQQRAVPQSEFMRLALLLHACAAAGALLIPAAPTCPPALGARRAARNVLVMAADDEYTPTRMKSKFWETSANFRDNPIAVGFGVLAIFSQLSAVPLFILLKAGMIQLPPLNAFTAITNAVRGPQTSHALGALQCLFIHKCVPTLGAGNRRARRSRHARQDGCDGLGPGLLVRPRQAVLRIREARRLRVDLLHGEGALRLVPDRQGGGDVVGGWLVARVAAARAVWFSLVCEKFDQFFGGPPQLRDALLQLASHLFSSTLHYARASLHVPCLMQTGDITKTSGSRRTRHRV